MKSTRVVSDPEILGGTPVFIGTRVPVRLRILLDESVPGRLGPLFAGHSAVTVQRRRWASIKNGKLLALAAGEIDVLLTADKGMEHQQNLATLPVSIPTPRGLRQILASPVHLPEDPDPEAP